MAEYRPIAHVDYVSGKANKKDKTVFRQKFAHDSKGAVICPMRREVYVIVNPRDWKKNPAKGAEKQKQDRWAELVRRSKLSCMIQSNALCGSSVGKRNSRRRNLMLLLTHARTNARFTSSLTAMSVRKSGASCVKQKKGGS